MLVELQHLIQMAMAKRTANFMYIMCRLCQSLNAFDSYLAEQTFCSLRNGLHLYMYVCSCCDIPLLMCSLVCRKRLPELDPSGKSLSKKGLKSGPQPYTISMDGLAEFKTNLDAIPANCRQFWSVELEHLRTGAEPDDNYEPLAQDLLRFADSFEAKLAEVYQTEVRTII